MTLLDATATLIDCAKTYAPDDRSVGKAVKRMEKRLRVLQLRAAKARRALRRDCWRDLQIVKPVCLCGHRFTFDEMLRGAEMKLRGHIVRFYCPACGCLAIGVVSNEGTGDDARASVMPDGIVRID